MSFSLGGVPFTPLTVGMDIDPIRKTSSFLFDAYSSRDLPVLLANLGKVIFGG